MFYQLKIWLGILLFVLHDGVALFMQNSLNICYVFPREEL